MKMHGWRFWLSQSGVFKSLGDFFRFSLAIFNHGLSLYSLADFARRCSASICAVRDDEGCVSWTELLAMSNGILACLIARGLRSGALIGLSARNNRYWIAGFLAAQRLGLRVKLMNTRLRGKELYNDLQSLFDSGASLLLVDLFALEQCQTVWRSDFTAWCMPLFGLPRAFVPPRLGPRLSGAVILSSSGTQGAARMVQRKTAHWGGIALLGDLLCRLPFKAEQRCHIAVPLCHGHGFSAFALAMLYRSPMCISHKLDGSSLLQLSKDFDAQGLTVVPELLRRILDFYNSMQDCDRSTFSLPWLGVISGSDWLDPGLAHEWMRCFGKNLYNFYGSTETGPLSMAGPEEILRFPESLGQPFAGVRVSVLDEHGQALEPGLAGRLVFSGPMVRDQNGDRGFVDSGGRLHLCRREQAKSFSHV